MLGLGELNDYTLRHGMTPGAERYCVKGWVCVPIAENVSLSALTKTPDAKGYPE